MRRIAVERVEAPQRDDDVALVERLEQTELVYDWERRVLEVCSQRVYSHGRALMPRQRVAAREILERRGAKA